jgi:hypothetical protein
MFFDEDARTLSKHLAAAPTMIIAALWLTSVECHYLAVKTRIFTDFVPLELVPICPSISFQLVNTKATTTQKKRNGTGVLSPIPKSAGKAGPITNANMNPSSTKLLKHKDITRASCHPQCSG